MYIVMYK